MTKFWSLVKLLFMQQYKSKPIMDNKKKNRRSTVLLVLLLAVCFAPLIGSIVVVMYTLGQISTDNTTIVSMLILACQGLVFVFGIVSIISMVFVPKDADKLIYMPISTTQLFLSKLAVAYLNEVITTAVAVLVVLVPFGIGAGASWLYYVMTVVGIVLIPLLPMLVGCIVAMPISVLIAKIGKDGVALTVLKLIMFVALMALYMGFVQSISSFDASTGGADANAILSNLMDSLAPSARVIHPNYMLASTICASSFVVWIKSFVIALLEFALLLGLAVLCSLPFYKYLLYGSLEGTISNKRKKLTDISGVGENNKKQRGVLGQLLSTSFKRTIRDSQLGFQAFAGLLVMPLVIIVLAMTYSSEENGSLIQLIEVLPLGKLIACVAIIAYMALLGSCTNTLGLYPISSENKSFYMLKTFPVKFERILTAKVILSTLSMLAGNLLTAVASVIFFKISLYQGLLMLIVLALFGFAQMCLTTHYDLANPKLGWSSFQQSLKNSKNAYFAMLVGLISAVLIAAVGVPFIVWYVNSSAVIVEGLMWLALISVGFVSAFVCYKWMVHDANKLFEQIEA